MPLYVVFCHIYLSPMGDVPLSFAPEYGGMCYGFAICLNRLHGPLYSAKGETGNASHHSLGERCSLLEGFKYQKIQLHLAGTSKPSRCPAAILLSQFFLLFLSEKV